MKGIKFRNGELSYKQFTQLTKEEKKTYINFLLTLKESELGFNDVIILNQFGKKEKSKLNKFLEL